MTARPPLRFAQAAARIAQPGDHRFTLRHDGIARSYRVHVPARYDPAQPAPLLVALHGGGGNMHYQADDARYGLIAKSEREGYIAVFPNGYSTRRGGRFATWNAGNCCGAGTTRGEPASQAISANDLMWDFFNRR